MSHRKPQRPRHRGPGLVKPAFNWGAQDRYIDLMNSEMEVSNILETKAYELSEEEKAPVIRIGGIGRVCNYYKLSLMKKKKNAELQRAFLQCSIVSVRRVIIEF